MVIDRDDVMRSDSRGVVTVSSFYDFSLCIINQGITEPSREIKVQLVSSPFIFAEFMGQVVQASLLEQLA